MVKFGYNVTDIKNLERLFGEFEFIDNEYDMGGNPIAGDIVVNKKTVGHYGPTEMENWIEI